MPIPRRFHELYFGTIGLQDEPQPAGYRHERAARLP